ncbi:divergent polysaccharide deacetylase family protein [Paenibacillus sp. JX-17]|uniref:Divergent polysaccharide deacetylase family protein n=1 Tax=Paenibacillus lacisoli TaxID=3064525 RepID=A0ABT9C9Q9_9BACL|nr:divergent polysaccharide deacetylase family protein [Paenibacillus sp. JX-17]MDO7905977.1 divergent polysaccharide deacetylase family protein [Paenibacillus sp. JX-17]
MLYIRCKHKYMTWLRSIVLTAGMLGLVLNGPGLASAGVHPGHPAPDQGKPSLAIIIDDLGNGMKGTEQVLSLPAPISVAVMPFLPTTKTDAERAHSLGHDVLVHLPMEPNKGKKEWLGPGAITSGMTDEEVRQAVLNAIADVPHAVGVNNHMGSKITSDRRIMSVVLDVCREQGLFFVDSRTNFRSVAAQLAKEKGMPPVGNDIFLDDQYNLTHISKQMRSVEDRLKQGQDCVTIGHVGVPGLYTASVLKSSLPRLQGQVRLLGISDFVRNVWGWDPHAVQPTDKR